MAENDRGTYVLPHTDRNPYALLFDLIDPWKIDIIDYLNENYMYDLAMEEIAGYTAAAWRLSNAISTK